MRWINPEPIIQCEVIQKEKGKYCILTHTYVIQKDGTNEFICRAAMDFPGGSDNKVSAYNTGDPGSIPGSGRSPEEGNGNWLQYSCLENPMRRGTWQATVHGVAKSRTRLRDFTSQWRIDIDSLMDTGDAS